MQIKVDRDLCEANGVCCGLAPDVFELDDDEMLVVKVEDVPAAALDRVNQAAARCPKGALQVAS
jgi:ferredoxin